MRHDQFPRLRFQFKPLFEHAWPTLIRLLWLVGIVGLPLSNILLIKQVEPFYSSIYGFLWCAYILSIDALVYLLEGDSLLSSKPMELVILGVWGLPVWGVFELLNRRTELWFYVMGESAPILAAITCPLLFGSILPGIFETMQLVMAVLKRLTKRGSVIGPSLRLDVSTLSHLTLLGILMLSSVLLFPKYCFWLTWLFAFFILDPICYFIGSRRHYSTTLSVFAQIALGDYTRLVSLAIAGFICGGLWEVWNAYSRNKWIYTVPLFDWLRFGEMPLLGFFGYPFFALEAYAMTNWLSLLRNGKNWQLRPDELGVPSPSSRGIRVAILLVYSPLLFDSSLPSPFGSSLSEPISAYFGQELGPQGIRALRERRADQGNEFLKLTRRPAEIEKTLFDRMRQIATVGELKGMGFENALTLERLGITSPCELAKQDPHQLTERLSTVCKNPRLAVVQLWISAAKRSVSLSGLQ